MRWVVMIAAAVVLATACAEGGGRGPRGGSDDAGAVPIDGGSTSDGGTGIDAGPGPTDGGTGPGSDAGPPEMDAGPACAAAGCHPMATCDDSSGTPVCTCNSGYSGDGLSCTDVDECAAGTDDCHTNATCTNTAGSFTCACDAGYTGDGRSCTDVDECAAGTDDCDTNATCTNTAGSFTCSCNSGWTGDGRTCTDVNECTAGTAGCDANATCSNTPGSFTCTCNSGYTGDGFTCTPVGPVCTTLEGFEAGTWPVSPWIMETAGGTVSTSAAHDGTYGITDPGWHYETATTLGSTGDLLRAWVRPGTGRAYIGFAASASGCKSFVAAPNTDDIRFQDNAGFGYSELNTSTTTFTAGRWYLMEVEFLGGGSVVGRLYDSDGTTLVNSVTQTFGSLAIGGVCIRSFNSFAIDTIEVCR